MEMLSQRQIKALHNVLFIDYINQQSSTSEPDLMSYETLSVSEQAIYFQLKFNNTEYVSLDQQLPCKVAFTSEFGVFRDA